MKEFPMVVLGAALMAVMGCGVENEEIVEERAGLSSSALDDRGTGDMVVLSSEEELWEAFGFEEDRWRYEGEGFRQVGLQFLGGGEGVELEYRVGSRDGKWGGWRAVEPYWEEAGWANAHAVFEDGEERLELRGGGALRFLQVQFYEEAQARSEIVRKSSGELGVSQQAVAPSSMVTSRSEWGSIDPHRVCNSVVAPWRMSIHHTASPSSDGGDPHARMRGMQSYHINSNGWCDIGYHFVVAQSGEIMQGRSHSDRPGAHVGGENAGNVGISMIGNYSSASPPGVQIENMAEIVGWVHEEHDITLNRDAVRGHREWPGQTTNCPGDVGLSMIDEILDMAEEEADYEVGIAIEVEGLNLGYEQGGAQSRPGGLEGEEVEVEVRVTNNSTEPIRDVRLALEFGEVGIEPISYRIESDHPAYDQSTWELNSAHDDEANPDHGAIGHREVLEMHAFSPQESKRVVVEGTLSTYNIGRTEGFGGVRAWVESMRDIYGDQEAFGDSPSTNEVGGLVQAAERIDVLSSDEWQFRSGSEEEMEGWRGGGDYEALRLNTAHDLLAQKMVEGKAGWVVAPEWTAIDGDGFDEMVIRSRSHDGEHRVRVGFGGEEVEEEVEFVQPGDGEYHLAVVPVGSSDRWRGEIGALEVWMRDGQAAGGQESGWYDIDYIYFQDRERGETTSVDHGVVEQEPVELWGEGQGSGMGDDGRIVSADFPGADGPGTVEVRSSGCRVSGGKSGGSTGWLVLLVGLIGVGISRWQSPRRRPGFQSG